MPYFTGDLTGPNASAVTLDDFPSSAGAAFSAAGQSTAADDPSVLGYTWLRMQRLNAGDRLDRASVEAAVKAAGVQLSIPDEGYTAGALDVLIQRKHDEARTQDLLDRAPTGFVPSTTRLAAHLAAGLGDPLNIAASFVPVVGEARATSLLARAGESFLARSAARAGIGAAEGAAGAAILEAPDYYLHRQLQDDYSMADALTNLAFGAAMGSVLHVAGGGVADLLRTGPHPATRFAGLSSDEIQGTFNFERQRATMTQEDQARALESFTPGMRRALAEPDLQAPVHELPAAGTRDAFTPQVDGAPAPPRAADILSSIAPDLQQTAMRTAIADFVRGRVPDVDAIQRLGTADARRESADAIDNAITALESARARLLGDASNLAERGVIRETRQQLKEHLSQVPDSSDAAVQVRAHEIQALAGSKNMLFKTAQRQAQAEMDARVADHASTAQRLQNVIDSNARAQHAVQAIHGIDQRIASLERSRQLVDLPTSTLDDVRGVAVRQAAPESVSIADFFAARAADERLATEPKSARLADAEAGLMRANERMQALAHNLELGGMDAAVTRDALASLQPWDAALADAGNLGQAARAAALCGLRS